MTQLAYVAGPLTIEQCTLGRRVKIAAAFSVRTEVIQEAMLDFQKRFLTGHLGAWTGKFAGAVRASAECDFCRELADLTERFVVQVRERSSATAAATTSS